MDQNFEDVVMECNNCHLEFYASTLRTDETSNLLMCVNCLSLPGSKINILHDRPVQKNRVKVKEAPLPFKSEPAQKATVPSDYSSYRCGSCQYEFRRKNGFAGNCPYCSKKGISLVRTR